MLIAFLFAFFGGLAFHRRTDALFGGIGQSVRIEYKVMDLGLLKGTIDGMAIWIGDDSRVTGWCKVNDEECPFIWDADHGLQGVAVPQELPKSVGLGNINHSGQIAGTAGTGGGQRGFVIDANGKFRMLSKPDRGWSSAESINDAGQIGGVCKTTEGIRTCTWEPDGKLRVLDAPSQYPKDEIGVLGGSINSRGDIAGFFEARVPGGPIRHALKWDHAGHLRDLGTLPGGSKSTATCINDRGEVGGVADTPVGDTNPFIYYPKSGMKQIPTPTGEGGQALGMNNRGDVVGDYGSGTRAFLWTRDVGPQDLTSLIDPKSGWLLLTARGVNNKRQIVGKGVHNGQFRPFLLTPIGR